MRRTWGLSFRLFQDYAVDVRHALAVGTELVLAPPVGHTVLLVVPGAGLGKILSNQCSRGQTHFIVSNHVLSRVKDNQPGLVNI